MGDGMRAICSDVRMRAVHSCAPPEPDSGKGTARPPGPRRHLSHPRKREIMRLVKFVEFGRKIVGVGLNYS